MPEIFAPILLRNLQRSWTCGSAAASSIVVSPVAVTAAMIAFSVAVTESSVIVT